MQIVQTKDISAALKEFALENRLTLSEVDFRLIAMQTYINTCHEKGFVKFTDAYKESYDTDEKLIQDHVRFSQVYKIEIFPKRKSVLELKYRIEMGEFSTYPILILSSDSLLPISKYKESEMLKLLYTEINKIKMRHKLLINLFSACLIDDLKEFVLTIYKDGFHKDASLLLFEGVDPEISQPSSVINHYLPKNNEAVTEVDESELIITYIKPIYGQAGLNAYGQRIAHGESNNLAKIEYEIDTKSIRVQESSDKIAYYSKKRGFVSVINNQLSISNKIVVKHVKRVEKQLTKKEENEVEVIISQTDVTRDGVGEGVELKSERIHITGHMGAKSNLEAKEVRIDGATHTDSFVTAKNVRINRHKGTLRCHKAQINSLEGGTLYATNVSVDTALSGQIYAEHVTIKSVKNRVKVYASKSITVERVLGEDNHFVIDYRKLPTLQSKLQFLGEELDDLKWKFQDYKKHSPDKLEDIREAIQDKEQEIDDIKLSHYEAVINILAPMSGLNVIQFAIPEKQNSIIYRTKANNYEPFSLVKRDGKIILEPVNISIDE